MTTSPEPTKGVPRHPGNSTFTPRADHNALADWVRDKVGETVANQAALPATGNWVAREITTLDTLSVFRWNGSAWLPFYVPWTSYTPATTNVSGGTITATYSRVGGIVRVSIIHDLTGANFTAQPSYSLPVNHFSAITEWLDGQVMLKDASPTAEILGIVRKSNATTVAPYVISASLAYAQFNNVTATIPFTWATGDSLVMNFSYRPA